MNKKNIYKSIAIAGIFVMGSTIFTSCASDEGNYDYNSLNELTISGIEEKYYAEQFEELNISPTITGSQSFNESDYDYMWVIYKYNDSALEPDTVSREKNLSTVISKSPANNYAMLFRVTDKNTGIFTQKRFGLSVVNSHSKGVVILSDVDGMADVSFINSLDKLTDNIYEAVNGQPAGRGPLGIYLSGRNTVGKKMILISTEDSCIACNDLDFSYEMNYKDMFYFPSSPGHLENIIHDKWGYTEHAIVDGKVYRRTIWDAGTNPLFGTNLSSKGKISKYGFHKDNIGAYFYDMDSKKFVYNEGGLVSLSDGFANEYWDYNNVGMDLVWGDDFRDADDVSNLRAIMQDSDGSRYVLYGIKDYGYDLDTWASWYYIAPRGKFKLPSDAAASSCYAISTLQNAFLYYASGSKIKCISILTGNAISEISIDGGNVDYMEFDPGDNTRLYVGTSNGQNQANSGSIYFLTMAANGQLTIEKSFKNVCGKVVDFETNYSADE